MNGRIITEKIASEDIVIIVNRFKELDLYRGAKVRKALQERDRELVESMLPESTIEYLKDSKLRKELYKQYGID